MSADLPFEARNHRSKKPAVNPPSISNPGHSGPTTFFLRSEKDMERDAQLRGRKPSRHDAQARANTQQNTTSSRITMGGSSFGVQSLEDTLNESFNSESTLSRTDSNDNEEGSTNSPSRINMRKRKAGNPVHPRILATGQRIISSEQPSAQASSSGSPISLRSTDSPFHPSPRRASNSSINLERLTPLRLSPHPESGMPSTPRSGSMQSLRLSDEEVSIMSDTNSQVLQSSSGEDEEDVSSTQERLPQLVMPSISMPARRPFTTRGRNMGRLKVMVVGPSGIGKTSLIKSIFRTCEDVVHIDPINSTTPSQSTSTSRTTAHEPTKSVTELHASTRPYPLWWSDMESSHSLWRRKSFGEGILERNISFVDTPGIDSEEMAERVMRELERSLIENARIETMSDNQLLNLYSGEGGTFVDAVIYVFEPGQEPVAESEHVLLRKISAWTNLIPVVGRADSIDGTAIRACQAKVRDALRGINAKWHSMVDEGVDGESHESQLEPFAVSSALVDDSETMDASLLMASDYLQPMAPSDLGYFVNRLLSPGNIARLRHQSAKKFLQWRREYLANRIDLAKQTLLQSPQFHGISNLTTTTDTGSLLEEPSKVLVPHSTSSYYRSPSPSAASLSNPGVGASSYALAQHDQQIKGTEPFRQVRLAKWAQDLQRSLDHERQRAFGLYAHRPDIDEKNTSADSDDEHALIPTHSRPPRGRLGGDLAVIDPRDPLGLLAFSQGLGRQGWFALQMASGLGLVGAVCWWVVRNWAEVQEWVGLSGGGGGYYAPVAVPAPERGWLDTVGEVFGFR